jgi:hypothetical protein
LNSLLKEKSQEILVEKVEDKGIENLSLEDLRKKMGKDHKKKVALLVSRFGTQEAIMMGRRELYKIGVNLGKKARKKLGVRNSFSDFKKAMKIIYEILGIEIQIEKINKNELLMFVNRCSLSENYNDITCQVLSAVDEGVVQGLNSRFQMRFDERITSGALKCKAKIVVGEGIR